jgi:hypothetical protein
MSQVAKYRQMGVSAETRLACALHYLGRGRSIKEMSMNQEQQFFMVKGPDGVPKVEHRDQKPIYPGPASGFDRALGEAKRLAGLHPGKKFFVLGAIAVAEAEVRPVEVKLTRGTVEVKQAPPAQDFARVFGY